MHSESTDLSEQLRRHLARASVGLTHRAPVGAYNHTACGLVLGRIVCNPVIRVKKVEGTGAKGRYVRHERPNLGENEAHDVRIRLRRSDPFFERGVDVGVHDITADVEGCSRIAAEARAKLLHVVLGGAR